MDVEYGPDDDDGEAEADCEAHPQHLGNDATLAWLAGSQAATGWFFGVDKPNY